MHELKECDLIIHAGDVGGSEILASLEELAPLHAVRGNVDKSGRCGALPETEVVEVGIALIYVLHDIAQLDLDPEAAGFAAVVYGHSHQPSLEMRGNVLFVNPGSAGPRRFDLPTTVARLTVTGSVVEGHVIQLDV